MSHIPRKRFGQNFLRDEATIEAIASAIAPDKSDHLVEIGPGEGAITQALVASGCRFDAIELDRDLRTRLLASFSTYGSFALHSADALRFDFASLQRDSRPLRVIGNLPYNISTPLLFKLLDYGPLIADMHFMLQLEVVERLAAEPGNKSWGRLGVMAQFQCGVEQLFEVPPEAFFPPPKVQSAIVRLTPKQTPRWAHVDREVLAKVVSQAFSQRRKTLRNNFKNNLTDTQFEMAGIDPQARAETLNIDHFVALTEASGH
jgi:16S rRNA (adenine1518-N6/adenine1519-N6)-dimethyltransferase